MADEKQIQWLDEFLGVKPGSGNAASLEECIQATAFAQLKLKEKQRLVIDIWKQIDIIKGTLQTKFAEIKQKGEKGGMRALDIDGTQLDELDFTEIDIGAIPKEIRDPLQQASTKISGLLLMAQEAKITVQGVVDNVFTKREMMEEFWTPLKRERIIPEGFIGDPVSETQIMLDETNKLYLEAVARHKEAGTLTAKVDLVSSLLGGGSDVASGLSSIMKEFTGADLDLATDILDTMGTVLKQGAELRTKLKSKDLGGGVSKAFSVMGTITTAVLSGVGVDDKITQVVGGAFDGAGIAAEFGQRVADGDPDSAFDLFGQLVESTLKTAAQGLGDSGAVAEGLKKAAGLAPTMLANIVKGKQLTEKAITGTLTAADLIELGRGLIKDVLDSVETLQPGAIENNEAIAGYTDMAAEVMKAGAKGLTDFLNGEGKAAVMENLLGMIDAVGSNLEGVLGSAGVPAEKTDEIVQIFEGVVTVPRMMKFLTATPPDILGMVSAAGAGLEKAFELASGGDSNIITAGKTLSAALASSANVVAVLNAIAKASEEEDLQAAYSYYAEAVSQLCKGLSGPLGTLDADVGEALSELAESTAANELLQEADADVSEEALANPNGIDNLIAKVAMDKMVLNLGMKIAQGGTAFLAKFVPGLGAASAAVKLAAELMAAGKRASQLAQWWAGAKDLSKAQSALLSSALNFVNNQADQLAYHGAQALAAATLLAGEIAKLAGPAAPIGAAIAGTAAGASKLIEVIHDKKIEVEVELAWNKTAKALRNPGNRRLGLEARQLNPSMAKYAIAWGAMVLKDPLASNVLRAAGLNQANLADPDADTHKLVKYLETFYDEDPTLYRDVDENPEWLDDEVELSAQFWRRARKNAIEKGKLVLANSQGFEGWLASLDTLERQLSVLEGELKAARTNFETAKANMTPPSSPSGNGSGKTPTPRERRQQARNAPVLLPLPEARTLQSTLGRQLVKLEEKSQALATTADLLGAYQPVAKPSETDRQRDSKLAMLRVIATLQSQARKSVSVARTEVNDARAATSQLQASITKAESQLTSK